MKLDKLGKKADKEMMVGINRNTSEKVAGTQKKDFGNFLSKMQGDTTEEKIRALASDIIKQGERLSEKIDISELKVYKKKIAEFLDEAVRSSNKFTKDSFLDRRGRHKVYAVVKKVNKELEELTKEVLSSEKNNIKILKGIEDIRGMILDLVL